jgi:hypothetical protein
MTTDLLIALAVLAAVWMVAAACQLALGLGRRHRRLHTLSDREIQDALAPWPTHRPRNGSAHDGAE